MRLVRVDEMTAISDQYLARVAHTPAGCRTPYEATLYRRTGQHVDGGEGLEYVRSAYGLCVDQALRELHVEVEVGDRE